MNQKIAETTQFDLMSIIGHFHRRNEVHVMRKLFHMGVGLAVLWLYYNIEAVTTERIIYATTALGLVGLAFDLLRMGFKDFNRHVLKIIGPIIRQSEVNSLTGLPFYALGTATALFFYQEKIAVLSILFLIFSDPIASYFGIRYGTDQIMPNKSVQGSAAGLCTCYIISLIYGLVWAEPTVDLLIFSLLAGIVGSVSELLSIFVDDNFTIPVVSGGGLTLLNMVFPIY